MGIHGANLGRLGLGVRRGIVPAGGRVAAIKRAPPRPAPASGQRVALEDEKIGAIRDKQRIDTHALAGALDLF